MFLGLTARRCLSYKACNFEDSIRYLYWVKNEGAVKDEEGIFHLLIIWRYVIGIQALKKNLINL